MTDAQIFAALKVFAVILFIAQSLITQAITNFVGDLGLTRVQVAVLSLIANGMGLALIYLPQINRAAGNRRGDSTDDDPQPPAEHEAPPAAVQGRWGKG